MTILVDLDDTLEQLLAALVKRANERFHRNAAVDDVTDWSIVCAFPGITKQEILDFMREADFWEDVNPVPGAAAAISAEAMLIYYYYMSRKEFGGVSGDLAGYFVTAAELAVAMAVAIMRIAFRL